MKTQIYGLDGKPKGDIELPGAFTKTVREDIIRRAVLAERSEKRQAYGTDPLAGKRTSAHYHGLRHYRYSMMNKEMARMPRIHGRVGYLSLTARFVPQATKGRKAHPPKSWKKWEEKINKKEWLVALYSAIAAGSSKELVTGRKHDIAEIKQLPIIIDDKLQEASKSSEVKKILELLGLQRELERTTVKRHKAGRGKSRGRKTAQKKGPLIVAGEDKGIIMAARNIAGVDAVTLGDLSVEMLAPGTHPGRLTIWTRSAVEQLAKTAK